LSHTTSWIYNNVGSTVTETWPDSGGATKTYDAMNRVLTITDRKSQVTTFTFDGEGNMATLTDAKSNPYTFTYDLMERKTQMAYPGGQP